MQNASLSPAGDAGRNGVTAAQTGTSASLAMIFRFRFWLHLLLFAAGFGISWIIPHGPGAQRVWLALPEFASVHLGIDLHSAITSVTALAILFAIAGAIMRTWAAASSSRRIGGEPAADRGQVLAAGADPWTRKLLSFGTVSHTLAVSVLMSWPGALFTVATVIGLQFALIAADGKHVRDDLNGGSGNDANRLSRGFAARWPRAIAGEIYMWGTAISFAAFGSTYNAMLIIQGVLVSFGVWIVVRGLMGK